MIQKTSIEAYDSVKNDLGKLQRQIYNLLKVYPNCSNNDLSRITQKSINTITPRIKELRDKGLVFFSHYKVDRVTNRRVMCWVAV